MYAVSSEILSFLQDSVPKKNNRKDIVPERADAKRGIPPNIAPKIVTPENYLQIWDPSATLIGQLAIITLFGAILGGIPLSGA